MACLVLGRDRVGQLFVSDGTSEGDNIEQRLRAAKKLSLMDMSGAEASSFRNRHSYFRSSPWASSDMFVSLIYGLDAKTRGLQRLEASSVWTLPPDYPERFVKAMSSRAR